jgi:DNA-binding transcriptional LysR family regulator
MITDPAPEPRTSMELRHLRYFVALAEELHFGRAAARLNVVQPALSQQIQQLERELGTLLLTRTKRHVALTEPGRLFLPEARRALAQVEIAAEVARRAARGAIGTLRLGHVDAAMWTAFPAVVRRYRQRYPLVEVMLMEQRPDRLYAALEAGLLDVAIGPPQTRRRGLRSERLLRDALAVALPVDHPLGAEPSVRLAQLADLPWVMLPRRYRTQLTDTVVRACASAGFTPRVVQEAPQLHRLLALVGTGCGVTLVPESARRSPFPGVTIRPLAGAELPVELVVAWKDGVVPPTIEGFRALLREAADGESDVGPSAGEPTGSG